MVRVWKSTLTVSFGEISVRTSALWQHEVFVSIYNQQNVHNSSKVLLPNTLGCWKIPHIHISKGGYIEANGGGKAGGTVKAMTVIAPLVHP